MLHTFYTGLGYGAGWEKKEEGPSLDLVELVGGVALS